jgi:hypothetical protein
MATTELSCSRTYYRGWRKQIRKRFDVMRDTERLLMYTDVAMRAIGDELHTAIEEIEDERDHLRQTYEAKDRACQSLPYLQRLRCERVAREYLAAETQRLDREAERAREKSRDASTPIMQARRAASRHMERVQAGVTAELISLATELAACAELAFASNNVSVTPAFGCPSEILPTIAFAGPRQPDSAMFYRQWQIPTIDVTSLDEVIDALARAPGPIKRIRLTCHGNTVDDPDLGSTELMELAAFKTTPPRTRPPDVLTTEDLVRLAEGDSAYFRWILFRDELDTRKVRELTAALELLNEPYFVTLSLDQPTDLLTELMFWLFITNRSVRSLTIQPAYGLAKADFLRAARLAADDLKGEAAGTFNPQALDELDNAIRQLIKNDRQHLWDFPFRGNTRAIARKTKSAVAALDGGFRNTLEIARQNLTPATSLDIRGCRIAQKRKDFLIAMADVLRLDAARVSGTRWLTTVGQSKKPRARVVSLDPGTSCYDKLQREARDQIVNAFHLRWLAEFGLGAHAGSKLDQLLRYFRDTSARVNGSAVLPLLEVKGKMTDLRPKSRGDVILSLGFRCNDEAMLREAMRIWLRSLWLDAPEDLVSALADEWARGNPPYFEALVEEVDEFQLATTGIAFPMSPSYESCLRRG